MARFPKRKAEIATLAAEIINGLTENAEDFPSMADDMRLVLHYAEHAVGKSGESN